MNTNNRDFFRLIFKRPLSAELKQIGDYHHAAEQQIYKAALVDISAGGARFYTMEPLPETDNVLFELKFHALNQDYKPYGLIVRSVFAEEGHHEYSIKFSLHENDTDSLIHLLNKLSIRLRRTETPSQCHFLSDEELLLFKPLLPRES